ncbi:MAG TPA: zinc ribbon domain-containing protein, partial [Candidatus Tectomicrobia bacterium]|nr:zinc ribbon domain-containing protein [Candidatus Tectomicrobia bacterium]
MRCSSCGFDNPGEMNFCGECGAPLQLRCPQCGAGNAPRLESCGACGTPLSRRPRTLRAAATDEPRNSR